jgi:LPS-assembly protein
VAHTATVYFKGVPVLYSPWLDFSLSNRRKTGFLAPSIGTTNNSGFEFSLPFYWNIAPNRDYTVAPRFLARRGFMLNNEFRYLERSYRGDLRADVLPHDSLAGEARWAYAFRHQQSITSRLSANVNYQSVSDDRFFVDLSDKIAQTSQTNLPQEGSLYYNGDWWSLFGRVQSFQTLQNLGVPVDEPYKRLPQLVLRAAQQNLHGFDARFFGEATNFSHPDKQSGIRQVYYPSIEYRFGTPFVYVTPKAGINYSIYSLRGEGTSSQTRTLPIFSVDSGMRFIRDGSLFGRKIDQTLEPRLYYVYIPFRRQDQLPVFDTSVSDFNLAQIFSENRFSGWDRINDANQLTAAATTRLIEPNTGRELLRATLGQRYYFTKQRVTIDAKDRRTSNRSDLLAGLTGSLTHNWWIDFGLQYNLDDGESKKLNTALRYQPQPGKVFNVGYRYTRDYLEQVDLSAQWPLLRNLSVLARWNYSLSDSTLVEALAGLEYNGGCWAVRGLLHSFVTADDKRSNGFFIQFELSGLARGVGSNPEQLLGRNISGYQRSRLHSIATEDYFPGMETE